MNNNYQIFHEPNVNEITKNSIIRIDTADLSNVIELNNWEYKIKDRHQNTYYIIPIRYKRGSYKNLKIKKEILEATKRIDVFRIELVLWHATEDEKDIIFNDLLVFDSMKGFNTIYDYPDLGETLEDTPENIKILKAEQKKLYNYFKKHFKNVAIDEMNM